MENNREGMIALIREKCVLANPKKDWNIAERTDGMWEEKVRLADVLLAICHADTKVSLMTGSSGVFYWWGNGKNMEPTGNAWDLASDDLERQSDEFLEFACGLLK